MDTHYTREHELDSRAGSDRRSDIRCECGHGAMWHPAGESCLGHQLWNGNKPCECLEYIPQIDRRES